MLDWPRPVRIGDRAGRLRLLECLESRLEMADEYREPLADFAATDAVPDLSSPALDVVAAFDRMPVRGERIRCEIGPTFFTDDRRERYREVTNPGLNRTDNHLQGIQRFKDHLYVSAGDLSEGRPHL